MHPWSSFIVPSSAILRRPPLSVDTLVHIASDFARIHECWVRPFDSFSVSCDVCRAATTSAGEKGKLKSYVDACAKVKRCKEEAVFLREEARDAVVYYQRQEDLIARAVQQRKDSQDHVTRSHMLLLERELLKVQRLKARMVRTQAHLNTLFGELTAASHAASDAAAEGGVLEPDTLVEEGDLGGDPDVFPEEDTEEETGDDEEEEELMGEDDSGYTSVRGDDLLGDVRMWI